MPTEQQVVTAVLTAINAALPAAVRAYEPGKVPATRPAEYAVVTFAERPGGTGRSGRHSTRGWIAYVMGVSQTSDLNARNTLEKAHTALRNKVLVVDGVPSTPIAIGPARPVAPDDGWFSGSKSFEFAL